MEDNIIFLMDGNKKKEYRVILSFEKDNNLYLVYTEDKIDEDGFIITYAGIFNENDKDVLKPIEDEEDYILIERLLENLDKEEENEK